MHYCIEMARRLAHLDLYFIEEPLSPDNVLGYQQLVSQIDSTRIASGEHEYTQYGFTLLFEHNAVEVVQPDVSWSGGVTALRRIAAMAGERDLPFIPHRGGSLFGLPLVLATPAFSLGRKFRYRRRRHRLDGGQDAAIRKRLLLPFGKAGVRHRNR